MFNTENNFQIIENLLRMDIFASGKISEKNTEFTEFKNRKRFFSLCH